MNEKQEETIKNVCYAPTYFHAAAGSFSMSHEVCAINHITLYSVWRILRLKG